MELSVTQYLLGLGSGAIVGAILGLVGGGGSILATPLLVYAVGVHDPHVAIGTSAFAVAATALANLANHARQGGVRWSCAAVLSAAGVAGAFLGSTVGEAVDGTRLLALFGGLMIAVGVMMLRPQAGEGHPATELSARNAPRLVLAGLGAGGLSGFFGIGGGFLIVPALMWASDMSILCAVRSSLVAVTAFGLTTTLNYARAGWVDWGLGLTFLAGGAAGGLVGAAMSRRLAAQRGALTRTFAVLIFLMAAYVLARAISAVR